MGYQDEWLLLEAEDDIDEVEHRQPTEEFLFYQAVPACQWGDCPVFSSRCCPGGSQFLPCQTSGDASSLDIFSRK